MPRDSSAPTAASGARRWRPSWLDLHMRHSMRDHYKAITPDAFLSKHIGEHLASSMEALWTLPLIALLIGCVGAAVGRRRGPARPTAAGAS